MVGYQQGSRVVDTENPVVKARNGILRSPASYGSRLSGWADPPNYKSIARQQSEIAGDARIQPIAVEFDLIAPAAAGGGCSTPREAAAR
jgi:hypothetical protein